MGKDIAIIALHNIDNEVKIKYENTPERLKYILTQLKKNGYQSINLIDIYNAVWAGGSLPDKPVIITSDDGYEGIYKYYPMVIEYGFRMTLFITLEYIADIEAERITMAVPMMPARRMLLWSEILEMSRAGFDIQSHGVNHGNYITMPLEISKWNLISTKKVIEEKIQKACDFHAWCNSNTDDRLWDKMQELGYKGYLRYSGGIENTSDIEFKAMKRIYLESIMPENVVFERMFVKGAGDK